MKSGECLIGTSVNEFLKVLPDLIDENIAETVKSLTVFVSDNIDIHRWDFSGYSRISGFRYLSKSNKNGFEMHFESEFSPIRIQTLT